MVAHHQTNVARAQLEAEAVLNNAYDDTQPVSDEPVSDELVSQRAEKVVKHKPNNQSR